MCTRTIPYVLAADADIAQEAGRQDRPADLATVPSRERIPELLDCAVAALLALFDGAWRELNSTRAGTDRIDRCHLGLERRYYLGDPAATDRFVAFFMWVPARDGHIFGGAFVNTSRTPPSIYVVPYIIGEEVRWTVSATSTLFTRETVRDLFAAVFEDDQDAAGRIAPLVGYDLFQMPWS